LVSQPFVLLLSQFAKPALQLLILHWPEMQAGSALGRTHALLQLPQLVVVVMSVSQPLVLLLSQFPKPLLQLPILHCPETQAGSAFARTHVFEQLPQLVVVVMLVSQPLVLLLSQLSKPLLQVLILHWPPEHTRTASGSEHVVVQLPQLVTLVCKYRTCSTCSTRNAVQGMQIV
jgi:hypothetical protein